MNKCLFILSFVCSFMRIAYGQPGKGANEEAALEYARSIYSGSLSNQSGIYSGPDYIGYPYPTKDGHPFFFSTELFEGDIYYDGMQYRDIPMWYDIAKNEVLAQHYDGFSKISLHQEKIRDFSIFNHHFINIDAAASARSGLAKGFYDQLYKGRSEVLVRRSKDFIVSTNMEGMRVNFSPEKDNILIRTGTEYFTVSSQKSVLKLFGKHEKAIIAHLKQAKLKFRKTREQAIVAMVAHYDKLSNPI